MKRTIDMKQMILFVIIGILVVGAVSFYGGVQYGKSSVQSSRSDMRSQFMRNGEGGIGGQNGVMRQGRTGTGMISGEVLSKDATSITVQLPDGGSKNIFISSSTKVLRTTEGTIDDVGVGSQIFGQGSSNSDGSISAQSIQLRNGMMQRN